MARWASLIEARRAENHVLLFDTGNFVSGVINKHQDVRDRYFFEGMKLLRYDAAVIAQNEIRFGHELLIHKAKRMGIHLLASNIKARDSGRNIAEPYIIKKIGGKRTLFGTRGAFKIGVFSVVLPTFIHSIDKTVHDHFVIMNPDIAALEAVSKLRAEGCDLIVALSFQGWKKSMELAKNVPDIDVIINGRKEHPQTYSRWVGNTIVVDTGGKRTSLTEIEVTYTNDTISIHAADTAEELPALKRHPDLMEIENRYEQEIKRLEIQALKRER